MAIVLAAVLLAAASPSTELACTGNAKGPSEELVQYYVRLSTDGREMQRDVAWFPPSVGEAKAPFIIVNYARAADARGRPTSLHVGAMASVEPLPRSTHATIIAHIGEQAWEHPWRTFTENLRPDRLARVPRHARAKYIYGLVPLAFDLPGQERTNPDLLDRLQTASALEVTVAGDVAGETFGARIVDLSDRAGRDALVDQARGEAEKLARTPEACKPIPLNALQ